MAIKTTRWAPDTCNCEIEYNWDDEVPESERVLTLSNVIKKCPNHSSLSDSNVYASVRDENPRKNIALERCLSLGPAALFDTTPEGSRVLKNGLSFNFSFTGTAPDRVLTIGFTGINLTTQQKNLLQSALDTRFGTGRVLIA